MSGRGWGAGALAFASGIFVADAGEGPASGWLVGGAVFWLAMALGGLRAHPVAARGCALALLFLSGALRLELRLDAVREDRRRFEALTPGAIHRLEADVTARREKRFGFEVELERVRGLAPGRLPERLLLFVPTDDAPGRPDRLLVKGQRVRLGVRVDPVEGTRNPGSRDAARSAARRGFAVRARLVDPAWVVGVGAAEEGAFRRNLIRLVRPRLEALAGGGLALALVLGDRRSLSDETLSAIRHLGLSHLMAISGLHVGLVGASAAWLVARRRGPPNSGRRLLASAVGVLAAGGYADLAGAGPAVVRAALLLFVASVALPLRRPLGIVRALALVALVLGVAEPGWFFDLGAQLSFAACGGLAFVFAGRAGAVRAWASGPRLAGFVRASTTTTLAASFAVAPWLASAGLPLVPWTLPSNLVAVPALGFLVLPASFGAVAAAATGGLFPIAPWLLPLAGFEAAACYAASELPVPRGLDGLNAPILWIVCLAGLALVRCQAVFAAAALWGVVALVGAPPGGSLGRFPEVPRIVFLDVGQGDATLVEGRTARILIDAGRGAGRPDAAGRVERALRALGRGPVDVLVVTHGDADHRGGALALLRRRWAEALWLPAGARSDSRLEGLAVEAAALGVPVRWVSGGERLTTGDIVTDVLGPLTSSGGWARSTNESSLVLRVELPEMRVLLTADIGIATEAALRGAGVDLRADVLKVGHHGSAGSTGPDFLTAVDPAITVVSAPCRPRRGLPNPGVLARLEGSGARLAWTGRDGAIGVARREGEWVVAQWGNSRRCLAHSGPSGPRLLADEPGRPLLDERPLRFARILRLAKRLAQLLLARIGILETHSLELPDSAQSRANGEGGIRGNLVRDLEDAVHQTVRWNELVDQADSKRVLGIDRLGRIEQMVGVDCIDLSGEGDGRLASRVEAEGDLLECEGCFGDGVAQLGA